MQDFYETQKQYDTDLGTLQQQGWQLNSQLEDPFEGFDYLTNSIRVSHPRYRSSETKAYVMILSNACLPKKLNLV